MKYVVMEVDGGGCRGGLSVACPNCSVEKRSRGGFGRLPWATVPKARGLGLMAGQRGANQGPITLSSARPGLAGDRQSEAARRARLTEPARFKGPRSVCLCLWCVC